MVYRCRNDAYWTLEFVSDGCHRLSGYQPAELLQRSYESIIHPEDRALVRRLVDEAVRQRQRFDVEYRILRADGSYRWVWERGIGVFDVSDVLLAVEGLIQDVTDRNRRSGAA
jgi:PAS domain S-box-containing protein